MLSDEVRPKDCCTTAATSGSRMERKRGMTAANDARRAPHADKQLTSKKSAHCALFAVFNRCFHRLPCLSCQRKKNSRKRSSGTSEFHFDSRGRAFLQDRDF